MAPFERKLTAEQRTAIYLARFEHGHTYAEIHRRATKAELVPGETIDVSLDYIGRLCRNEEQRRNLRFRSPLADKPHRDAIEELRRGLIAAADDLLSDYRATAKHKPKNADPERGRQIARLIKEAAAIPTPKTETPKAPGATQDGRKAEGVTRSGVAGRLLAAHRNHQHTTEPDTTHDQPHQPEPSDTPQDTGPGSLTHAAGTPLAA